MIFAVLPISRTAEPNSNLGLIVTNRGGHLGFLEGFSSKPKPFHFMERFAQQFVSAVKTHGQELISTSDIHERKAFSSIANEHL